jgi:hypothetical protein
VKNKIAKVSGRVEGKSKERFTQGSFLLLLMELPRVFCDGA